MSDAERPPATDSAPGIALAARTAIGAGVLGAAVTGALSLNVKPSIATWALGSAGLFVAGAVVALQLRILSPQRVAVRLALTGMPGAGKTVLANLIFDRLMRSGNPRVQITPQAATAISVYQAIRNLDDDRWPARTSLVNVYRYLAELRYRGNVRPLLVSLELGDTAGENWLDLAHHDQRAASPDRDSYLEYVIASNALVHVISADSLVEAPTAQSMMRREVADLLVVTQLVRAVTAGRSKPDLLLDISKCDLWLPPDKVFSIVGVELHDRFVSWVSSGAILDPAELALTLREIAPSQARAALTEVVRAVDELAVHFRSISITFSSLYSERFTERGIEHAHPADPALAWIERTAFRSRRTRSRWGATR